MPTTESVISREELDSLIRDAKDEVAISPERFAGIFMHDGKILVDVSNPISADFKDLTVGLTTSAAEQIQAAAPGARVVKAFNTIFAQIVSSEARKPGQVQALIAGDDEDAKSKVRAIATAIGFAPIDAGALRNSRFLEPVGMMNIQFGFFLGAGPTTAPTWAHAA
jgi:predicted dinucleotide-binding enzyme